MCASSVGCIWTGLMAPCRWDLLALATVVCYASTMLYSGQQDEGDRLGAPDPASGQIGAPQFTVLRCSGETLKQGWTYGRHRPDHLDFAAALSKAQKLDSSTPTL
jgi:hypothetical protein